MKKIILFLVTVLFTFSMASCTPAKKTKAQAPGITPFNFSEEGKYILNFSDINCLVFKYVLPKGTHAVKVKTYYLDANGKWKENLQGQILEPANTDISNGTCSIKINNDYSFKLQLDGGTWNSEKISMDKKSTGRSIVALEKFQKIEFNKEIPIAIISNSFDPSGTHKAYEMNDFFKPEKFKTDSFNQAITFICSDKTDS